MSSMLSPEQPYIIVSVVTPETDDPSTSGRVINFPCAPTISHEMLEQGDGLTWSLRGPWRDRGYATMDALYLQERNAEGAAAWAKYLADAQAGKRVGSRSAGRSLATSRSPPARLPRGWRCAASSQRWSRGRFLSGPNAKNVPSTES